MLLKFENINLNLEYIRTVSSSAAYILFLHGFTGSSNDWKDIAHHIDNRFNIAVLDFIGHGKSDSPAEEKYYSPAQIINQLNFIINCLRKEKVILAGYSMGGRAALSYAVKFPQNICGLILESSTTGISSENLRIERIERDKELSEFILNNSIEAFVDYWRNLDLFNSQKNLPTEKLNEIKKAKLNNDRTGLANMLKGFSTGKMEPLFDQVKNIPAKTLLISGELDEKFTTINSQIVNNFQSAEHIIIKNAGHNTHLEQPSLYLDAVNNFLKQF